MGVVKEESAKDYIKRLGHEAEREELFLTYVKSPYQVINDSPTLKHYTNWNAFDSLSLEVREGKRKAEIEPPLKDYKLILVANNVIEGAETLDSPGNAGISPKEHKLVALNLALSKKVKIDRPGRYLIYHYVDEDVYSPINVEVEAKEDVFEVVYYAEGYGRAMQSSTIYIDVGKNAAVNFSLIVKGENSSNAFSYSKARVEGSINTSIFVAGAANAHVQYKSFLQANSSASFNAKALGTRDNNIDVVTDVIHEGARSVSNGVMKSIAANNSLSVIRGDARIEENALDSSTSIIGRALMLGRDAKAVVAPMLEVRTGRVVTAKHSASISRVNEDLLFYLQNRGFDRKTAEGLLIRGFLSDENDLSVVKDIVERIVSGLGY
ncbi:MAG: FeS assembly protein SufD [Candidatus Aramenus sulfurataquae]|uniref:Fe-S cluster assembly protein SufD n=5 Tax=Candidatus Aramenus sulfurataquae TaxID=1326980 RepID=W7KI51_9CREN|nr:MAG: FeS assembly protein SufD [Candidatus Aramenus sulfurataquae]